MIDSVALVIAMAIGGLQAGPSADGDPLPPASRRNDPALAPGHLPEPAEALRRTIARHRFGPGEADRLLTRCRDPQAYRHLLLYGEPNDVRVAARCLAKLRDPGTVGRILDRVEGGELRSSRYPAALFGWVVGAHYDRHAVKRLRALLGSEGRLRRIFALEAFRVMTYVSWRMPTVEPDFANPGDVWAMRRYLARSTKPDEWLRRGFKRFEGRLDSEERAAAARFIAGFLRDRAADSLREKRTKRRDRPKRVERTRASSTQKGR